MKTGIIIGGTLEMIALGWMNIGAAVAPDAALASIISIGFSDCPIFRKIATVVDNG